MNLLVDIGGTKTVCGESSQEKIQAVVSIRYYLNKEFSSLSSIINRYKQETSPSSHWNSLAIGLAGPVRQEKIKLTNLNWSISKYDLKREFSFQKINLFNDLQASAYGLPSLNNQEDVFCLQEGTRSSGTKMIISSGTGLGEAALYREETGSQLFSSATEGGHASFSPNTSEQLELLKYLWQSHSHVSWERVLSGGLGIPSLFRFFRDSQFIEISVQLTDELYGKSDKEIGPILWGAYKRGEKIARKVFELFVQLYASETANYALKTLPYGGIYLGGDIARKIFPVFKHFRFVEHFLEKGRMASILREFPIYIITKPYYALYSLATTLVKSS